MTLRVPELLVRFCFAALRISDRCAPTCAARRRASIAIRAADATGRRLARDAFARASHAIRACHGDVHLLRDARRIVGRGDCASDHEHVGAGGRDRVGCADAPLVVAIVRRESNAGNHRDRISRRARLHRRDFVHRAHDTVAPRVDCCVETRRERRRVVVAREHGDAESERRYVSRVLPRPLRVRRVRPATSRHHPRCGSSRR